jgi:hypothetical protein
VAGRVRPDTDVGAIAPLDDPKTVADYFATLAS